MLITEEWSITEQLPFLYSIAVWGFFSLRKTSSPNTPGWLLQTVRDNKARVLPETENKSALNNEAAAEPLEGRRGTLKLPLSISERVFLVIISLCRMWTSTKELNAPMGWVYNYNYSPADTMGEETYTKVKDKCNPNSGHSFYWRIWKLAWRCQSEF